MNRATFLAVVLSSPRARLNSLLADGGTVANYRPGVGMTNDGAGECSAWANQIGAAPSLTAASTRRPTIQSDGSLLFNGSANLMKTGAFTLNQPTTIYVVYRLVAWTLNAYIFDGDSASSGSLFCSASSPNIAIRAPSAVATNANHAVGVYQVDTIVFNGASSSLQVDSTTATTGNPGSNNMGGLTLGGAGNTSSFTNVQFREVIVRNVADTANTQARIQRFLKLIYQTP